MKKVITSVFSLLLAVMILLPLMATPVAALPNSEDMVDSYFYDYFGKAVAAPLAYRAVETLSATQVSGTSSFEPVDLFVRNGLIYIVDRAGNSIHILDSNFDVYAHVRNLFDTPATETDPGYAIPDLDKYKYSAIGEASIDSEMTSANKNGFNGPEGIYVTEDDLIYVADKNNRRVVVFTVDPETKAAYVKQVFQSVKVSILGKDYLFKPSKLVVDASGGMQIIAYAVNRGVMELDYDGTFANFIGAPNVTVNVVDWFWRLVSTDEQKKRLVKYVPTEYNNITQDSRGFAYCTISTLSALELRGVISSKDLSGKITPIVKLNSAGLDILRRKGVYAPVGDLEFNFENSPQIVDVDVFDNGCFVILDQATGRFFTYDTDGNFLYMGGGSGNQFGRTKTPYSIAVFGDYIVVSDIGNKSLVVYESTDYAKAINNAVTEHAAGHYDASEAYWHEVINFNSNMYIAYIGLGKSEMRKGMALYDDSRLPFYENSLKYFEVANEKEYYSTAFKELQRAELEKYFTLIAICFIVLFVGLIVLYFVMKNKKTKKEAKAK